MEILTIGEEEDSPEMRYSLEIGKFELSGNWVLEDTKTLSPFHDVFQQYLAIPDRPVELDFRLNYFDTTSSKFFYQLFKSLEDYQGDHFSLVTINWYYEAGDQDMLETGQEFQELVQLNFSFKNI
jgi:SiaC family regulatory phosphoprotein